MKKLLLNHEYMKLFIANTISRFGDSVDMIAYGFMVYQLTGSKILLATIYVFNLLPSILFSSFAGAVVDYFSKKKIVVVGNLLRGGLVVVTAILYQQESLRPWHLFLLTFLHSTIEAFVSPSMSDVVPKMVDEEQYIYVNSTMQSISRMVELLGMAVAGAIIGWAGIEGAMLTDAITFLVAGSILLFTVFPKEVRKELTKSAYKNSYKEGLRFVFRTKGMFPLMMSMALLNFFLTPINALAPAYVEDVLKKGPEAIGYFTMAFVIGNIMGGFFVGKISGKLSLEQMLTSGLVLTGIFYAMMSLPAWFTTLPSLWIACGTAGSVGFFVTFASAGLSTFFMTYVPKEMMARFSSVVGMFALSAMPLGSMVSGVLSSLFGMMVLILVFGILFALTAFLPFLALRQIRQTREEEAVMKGDVNLGGEAYPKNTRRDPNYDGSLSD